MSCRSDKWNLFLSTNVLLFDVFTILTQNFVLFFSIISQKRNFMSKEHICKEAHYLPKWYHNEYKEHVICYSAIQSSI